MDKGILQKYTGRPDGEPGANVVEIDAPEDPGCFGWLRGVRDRAIMLELRKKSGNILAIGYAWIDRIEFEPSEGITLSAGGRTIRIRGHCLNAEVRPGVRLFEGLTRQRVPWVREVEGAEGPAASGSSVMVDEVKW